MGKLVQAVKSTVEGKRVNGQLIRPGRPYLIGIDGRRIHVRSGHAALNTLLQSAGALIMKRALVLLHNSLAANTLTAGKFWFVANIHDEWQIECLPEVAEDIGKMAAGCIAAAGEFYGFKCPLKGNYVIGKNWAETH
jgi:DNA polymerase I